MAQEALKVERGGGFCVLGAGLLDFSNTGPES